MFPWSRRRPAPPLLARPPLARPLVARPPLARPLVARPLLSLPLLSLPLLSLLLLSLLAACRPGADLPPLPGAAGAAYGLGAADQLRVIVFNDPRLTGEFRVSDNGTLNLPLLGALPVAGRSPAEAGEMIAAEMRRQGLFRSPSVAVEVLAYRPVFVLGMVERGGQFPYQPGMTVLSAVALAGGFNYRAVQDQVAVTRAAPGPAREYRASRQAPLLPGDVVTVFERQF